MKWRGPDTRVFLRSARLRQRDYGLKLRLSGVNCLPDGRRDGNSGRNSSKADQQCRDCEQSLSKIDERLAQNKEAAEQLSKEKAELDTRFAGVNEVLSRLRSQPMVDPAAESAATLAADQAIKMRDGVLAALARFQSE